MIVREADVPVNPAVRRGGRDPRIDPMYVANEGKLVALWRRAADARHWRRYAMCRLRAGSGIGRSADGTPGMVLVQTSFGGRRVMDQLVGDPCRESVERRISGHVEKPIRSPEEDRGGNRACAVDDDRSELLKATRGHDVGHQPELEDIILQAIPDAQGVVHNQVVDYAVGQEYAQAWFDAEKGELDPFVLVIEGSLGNEEIQTGMVIGRLRVTRNGQPITMNECLDSLPPRPRRWWRLARAPTYGGIPAMEEQPHRCDGRARLPGVELEVEAGLRCLHPRLPGAARQHDRGAAVPGACTSRSGPAPELDRALRPKWLFGRTVREVATAPASPSRASSRRSTAPTIVVWSNSVARARWSSATSRSAAGSTGVRRLSNVGGICMACTMPASPTKFMPFMDPTSGECGLHVHQARLRPHGPLLPQAQHRQPITTRNRNGGAGQHAGDRYASDGERPASHPIELENEFVT